MQFRKILAIDDSDVVLKFHRFTLRHLVDAELLTASDGVEGFRVFKENPDIDLILLDINMPLLDGFSFLRMLRNEPGAGQDVSIVIISTEDQQEDIREGFDAGADAYITKPFERSELIQVLEGISKARKQKQGGGDGTVTE